MKLSEKSQNISESLTLAISAKAKRMKAEGLDVVGFGAGEPDFDTPDYIVEAAKEALNEGFTHYTPASGTDELKKAICKKFARDNNLEYVPEQIIVSNGAKHSLFNTFQALLNPGDEVIIPQPYWVSYPETVKMGDGKPVYIETREDNNFKVQPAELKKNITPDTKALILNSPNNPNGAVYSRDELKAIADLAVVNKIYIISDEVYENLVYDGQEHISIASLGKEIKNLTIVINGMSKTFAMTGWRIGYTAASKEIISVMSNIQSHSTSNPNSIAQYASTVGLNNTEEAAKVIKYMTDSFDKRRKKIVEKIDNTPRVSSILPQGAFYVMMNIEKIIGTEVNDKKIEGSLSFADLLLDMEKVAVVPGIAFGADNYVRLSYATSMDNICTGLDRIKNFTEKLM